MKLSPLHRALLRRIDAAGVHAAATDVALRANHQHAIVWQRGADLFVPLPNDGVWHNDDGALGTPCLAQRCNRRDAGVRLAHAHVKPKQPTIVGDKPLRSRALMRLEDNPPAPARDGQLVRAILRSHVAAKDAIIGVLNLSHQLGPDGNKVVEGSARSLSVFESRTAQRLLRALFLSGHGIDLLNGRRPEQREVVIQIPERNA